VSLAQVWTGLYNCSRCEQDTNDDTAQLW
jgi:hypothetical protein